MRKSLGPVSLDRKKPSVAPMLGRFYVASADRDPDAIDHEPAADPATKALEAVAITWSCSAQRGYAARTIARKLSTSCFRRSDCFASSPAEPRTSSAAVPTWLDACVTPAMFCMTP